jgi:hypothetical protein
MFSMSESEEFHSCVDRIMFCIFSLPFPHLTKPESVEFLSILVNRLVHVDSRSRYCDVLSSRDFNSIRESKWSKCLTVTSNYNIVSPLRRMGDEIPPETMFIRKLSLTKESSFFIFIKVDFCQPFSATSASISSRNSGIC